MTTQTGTFTIGTPSPSIGQVAGFRLTLDPKGDVVAQVDAQEAAIEKAGWLVGEGIVMDDVSFISVLDEPPAPVF